MKQLCQKADSTQTYNRRSRPDKSPQRKCRLSWLIAGPTPSHYLMLPSKRRQPCALLGRGWGRGAARLMGRATLTGPYLPL